MPPPLFASFLDYRQTQTGYSLKTKVMYQYHLSLPLFCLHCGRRSFRKCAFLFCFAPEAGRKRFCREANQFWGSTERSCRRGKVAAVEKKNILLPTHVTCICPQLVQRNYQAILEPLCPERRPRCPVGSPHSCIWYAAAAAAAAIRVCKRRREEEKRKRFLQVTK